MDGDGFACLVVDEEGVRRFDQNRPACAQFVDRAGVRADDLFGRHAVNPLAEDAHEVRASAGDKEGFEAVRAQVGQQFEHGLVGELVVGAVEVRVLRGGEPRAHAVGELDRGHAGAGQFDDPEEALVVVGEQGGKVAGKGGLDGGIIFPLRFVWQSAFEFVQRESQLERHGIFRPEGAVIVDDRDALGGWHKIRRFLVRHAGDKINDRLFRRRVVPGGEGWRDFADRITRGGEAGRRGGQNQGSGPLRPAGPTVTDGNRHGPSCLIAGRWSRLPSRGRD